MVRSNLTYLSIAAVATLAAGVAIAQTTAPTTAPATGTTPTTAPAAVAALPPLPATRPVRNQMPLEELEAAAIGAFEANDFATALPLLKDLAVRLRNSPEQVAPLLEKVRVAEASLAKQQAEVANAPRTPHEKPVAGKPFEVTLQNLGNFDYDPEKGGGIPEDVMALSGSTVSLQGFMIPIEESAKVTKFVLVPDLFACCFGQPPQMQHTAIVVCPPGKAVSYFPEEITVIGELTVSEVREEGYVTHLFEVKAASIRPLAK